MGLGSDWVRITLSTFTYLPYFQASAPEAGSVSPASVATPPAPWSLAPQELPIL